MLARRFLVGSDPASSLPTYLFMFAAKLAQPFHRLFFCYTMGLRFQAGACPGRYQGQAAEGPLREAEGRRQGPSSPLLRPPNTGNYFLLTIRTGVPRVFRRQC